MKYFSLILSAALVLLLGSDAFCEYYRYTDESGVVRFTDDTSLIPEDQRPDVEIYQSTQSGYTYDEMTQEESVPDARANTNTDAMNEGSDAAISDSESRQKRDELDAIRDELKRTYAALEAEKQALGPPPPNNARFDVKKEYNNNVMQLNKKIDNYQKQAKDLQKQIDEYNQQTGL